MKPNTKERIGAEILRITEVKKQYIDSIYLLTYRHIGSICKQKIAHNCPPSPRKAVTVYFFKVYGILRNAASPSERV
jgi:hypothetical protein